MQYLVQLPLLFWVFFVNSAISRKKIIRLFITDAADLAELLKIAVPGMKIYLSMLPIVGFQVVSAAFFFKLLESLSILCF